MWKRSEVNGALAYRVALRQHPNGKRSCSLSRLGSISLPPDTALLTQVVPTDLLLRGDLIGISEAVRLENGDPFFVDAHCTWFTEQESEAMDKDVSFDKIPWLNGLAPWLAPR